MLTCVKACRHLPAYDRPGGEEPLSRLVSASEGQIAYKLKNTWKGKPYKFHRTNHCRNCLKRIPKRRRIPQCADPATHRVARRLIHGSVAAQVRARDDAGPFPVVLDPQLLASSSSERQTATVGYSWATKRFNLSSPERSRTSLRQVLLNGAACVKNKNKNLQLSHAEKPRSAHPCQYPTIAQCPVTTNHQSWEYWLLLHGSYVVAQFGVAAGFGV